MKNLVLLFALFICSTLLFAQEKQSLAFIRKDARSYLVYSDGSKEELPYFIIESEGASDGLIRAKVMFPTKEVAIVYFDKDANIVLKPSTPGNYEGRILPYSNGYARFLGYNIETEEEAVLLFDKKGELVFSESFMDVSLPGSKNGWVFIEDKDKHGFYDKKLRKKLDIPDTLTADYNGFSEGICVVSKSYLRGAINGKGEFIAPVKYEDTDILLSDGVLLVQAEDGVKKIDKKGKELVTIPNAILAADYMTKFENGMLPIRRDGGVLIIDKKGKVLAEIQEVDNIISFDGQVLTADFEGVYKAFDISGQLLNTFEYSHMGGFMQGYSYFYNGSEGGFVHTSGEKLLLDWDVIWDIRNGGTFF